MTTNPVLRRILKDPLHTEEPKNNFQNFQLDDDSQKTNYLNKNQDNIKITKNQNGRKLQIYIHNKTKYKLSQLPQ